MFFIYVASTYSHSDRRDLNNDDLLICSPTVLAFILGDKFWCETIDDLICDTETDMPD